MQNTADVPGSSPIAVLLQSILGVSAINPLVAFYDIHGGKREVLFFYFVPDTTRDFIHTFMYLFSTINKPKSFYYISGVVYVVEDSNNSLLDVVQPELCDS
jgi:hypothetical protein